MSNLEAQTAPDFRATEAPESLWKKISNQAYSPENSFHFDQVQPVSNLKDQAAIEALGFPQVPTMTAETQAAGQLDVLLRDWNSGQPFSQDQMQQITKSIRDGVYGIRGPVAVQEQLTEIQNTLNRYLKGGETPFRDSTLSTPLEVRLLVDSENQIHMGIRNSEVKKGEAVTFPLVEGKGPKYPPF